MNTLFERAASWLEDHGYSVESYISGYVVIKDPLDDEDGFQLEGPTQQMVLAAYEHLAF